jgi:hypothetical protein
MNFEATKRKFRGKATSRLTLAKASSAVAIDICGREVSIDLVLPVIATVNIAVVPSADQALMAKIGNMLKQFILQ